MQVLWSAGVKKKYQLWYSRAAHNRSSWLSKSEKSTSACTVLYIYLYNTLLFSSLSLCLYPLREPHPALRGGRTHLQPWRPMYAWGGDGAQRGRGRAGNGRNERAVRSKRSSRQPRFIAAIPPGLTPPLPCAQQMLRFKFFDASEVVDSEKVPFQGLEVRFAAQIQS